ncbi:hypothetical protein [Brenneria izbisi]|uniref:Uncharacterized protein n=1 Tax=Brenneria izbisi TaxID=2939450 RepID=A0AA41Y025_9GAMM|nr:hypothetical protein [Brenneria izbisi]MCV9878157.1 hypothetical protein [Brenneria izbisi]MCV9881279.1 hypothetical protein [Brenneria izbisi]
MLYGPHNAIERYRNIGISAHLNAGKITTTDRAHPVLFSASFGFRDAVKRTNPVTLEPVMKVEAETLQEYAGSVMNEIMAAKSSR